MKNYFQFGENKQEKLNKVGCHVRVENIEKTSPEMLDGMITKYDKENDIFLVYLFSTKEIEKWEPEHINSFFDYIKIPEVI